MLEHIQTYWVTYACGILASVITGLITYIKTTRTKRKSGDAAEQQAIRFCTTDCIKAAGIICGANGRVRRINATSIICTSLIMLSAVTVLVMPCMSSVWHCRSNQRGRGINEA